MTSRADEARRQESGWRAQIDAAPNAAAVVQLCVDFLSHWTAHRRAGLPDSCQPPVSMHLPSQVVDYALRLAHARLLERDQTPELHAMASFFAAASARLSQILASASNSMRVPFFAKDPSPND